MTSLLNLLSNPYLHDDIYAVVDRLKAQHTLPEHSFLQTLPYFSFSSVSLEAQIKELFLSTCDLTLYKDLLGNISSLTGHVEPEALSRRLSKFHVMNFAQIVLYKVLPCPEEDCGRYPRQIVTHNQYRDHEYECPFYHHERDRRRMVITVSEDDEFLYKANYYEEGKRHGDKDKYSQNYFESMFHPLYYKMFKCKREYCNLSSFCPFFHSEGEKKIWDDLFTEFVGKDRANYVRDKQKYVEANGTYSVKLLRPEGLEGSYRGYYYESQEKSKQKNIKNHRTTYNNHHSNSATKAKGKKENGSTGLYEGSDAFWSFLGKVDKEFIGHEVW